MRTRKNIKTMRIDNKRLRMIVSESVRRTLTEMAQQRMPESVLRALADNFRKYEVYFPEMRYYKNEPAGGTRDEEIDLTFPDGLEATAFMRMYCTHHPHYDEYDVEIEPQVLVWYEKDGSDQKVHYTLTPRQKEALEKLVRCDFGDWIDMADEYEEDLLRER